MPVQSFEAPVARHEALTPEIRLLAVTLPAEAEAPRPGQFYMLRAWRADEAPLLSRPISVHAYDAPSRTLSFLYEVRGEGTQKLAALQTGGRLQLTGPAGNGFPLEALRGRVALVGGGIGTAPLLALAQALAAQGCQTDFYAGFRSAPYGLSAFGAVCSAVHAATDDGSFGHHGFVTELVRPEAYDAVCVCGPAVMMEKLARMCAEQTVPCYVSLEAKMACGLGACLGCTCHTKKGPHSVCKDGPVFEGRDAYDLG